MVTVGPQPDSTYPLGLSDMLLKKNQEETSKAPSPSPTLGLHLPGFNVCVLGPEASPIQPPRSPVDPLELSHACVPVLGLTEELGALKPLEVIKSSLSLLPHT